MDVAVLIRHRTRPGMRDAVQQVWKEHLAPAIEAHPAHRAYVYSLDAADPDVICAFQVYASAEAAREFLLTPAYAAYEEAVRPLLEGPPEVTSMLPVWTKGSPL